MQRKSNVLASSHGLLRDKFGSPVTLDKRSFVLRSIGKVTEEVPETLLLYVCLFSVVFSVFLFVCFVLVLSFLLIFIYFLICLSFCVVHRKFRLRLPDYNKLRL
jgi:hypothetical protein